MSNKKGYWLVFDSYPETNEEIIKQNMEEFNLPREKVLYLKKVSFDHNIERCKRYLLVDKLPSKVWWLNILLKLIGR